MGSYVVNSWTNKNRGGKGPIVAETRTDKRHGNLQSKGAVTKLRSERSFGDGRELALFEGKSPEEVFGEKGMVATQNVLEDKIMTADELGHHNSRAKYFFIERYSDSYRNELTDFVKTLQNKKAPSISAEDGLASLVIAIAAKKSLKENKPVNLS